MTDQPQTLFGFAARFWVFESIVRWGSARGNLVVVDEPNFKTYHRKKARWKLAVDQVFASRQEAINFTSTLGELLSLEDPNKAPRMTGTDLQVFKLGRLKQCLELTPDKLEGVVFVSEREIDLVRSLVRQSENCDGCLTAKQWDLVVTLADRLEARGARRRQGQR